MTKPSTPRLSEVAKHVRAPAGITSTGWPAVRDKAADLGISFRPWQHAAGQLILAKRANGKYAATIGGTGMSIPRQVGKTFLLGAIVFSLCLLRPGLTVIWTAQRLRTADETFGKMQAMSQRKRIAPHMLKPVLGSGEEEVRFRNGSRILFGARDHGFGRGFDEVDVLIFDEAQILKGLTLDDMIPATNQTRQDAGALVLFAGTPPKPTDEGGEFWRMRSEALSGEDADTGWIEFGADEDFRPTPVPGEMTDEDWRQVAKANPSFPLDTPREAILRMRKMLGPESFIREGLGIWDERDDKAEGLYPAAAWSALEAPGPDDSVPAAAVGVDMSHDRQLVAAGCWSDDDTEHLEVLLVDPLGNVSAAVEWLATNVPRRTPILIDGESPAMALVPGLKSRKRRVIVTNGTDMAKACGLLDAAMRREWSDPLDRSLTHAGQTSLDEAIAGAQWRAIGKAGGRGLDRRDPTTNIAPAVAAVLALLGAGINSKRKAGGRKVVTA